MGIEEIDRQIKKLEAKEQSDEHLEFDILSDIHNKYGDRTISPIVNRLNELRRGF